MKTKVIFMVLVFMLIPQFVFAAPSAPASINVTGIGDTSANVSWSVQNGANQYEVYVDGQQWTSSNNPGAVLQGLQPNTQYSVYVIASDSQGDSTPSPTVNFTTLPMSPAIPEQPNIKILSGSLILNWQPLPMEQVITAYRIYLDGIATQDVLPIDGIQTVTLTNLSLGSHTVSISGINANKEGPLSQSLSFNVSALNPPEGLTMANHNDSTIWITWQPVKNADAYTILLNGQAINRTDQTKYMLNNLNADTSYQIQVKAVAENGNESVPTFLQVSTLPTPIALNVSNLNASINSYEQYFTPFIVPLFVVIGGVILARNLKISLR